MYDDDGVGIGRPQVLYCVLCKRSRWWVIPVLGIRRCGIGYVGYHVITPMIGRDIHGVRGRRVKCRNHCRVLSGDFQKHRAQEDMKVLRGAVRSLVPGILQLAEPELLRESVGLIMQRGSAINSDNSLTSSLLLHSIRSLRSRQATLLSSIHCGVRRRWLTHAIVKRGTTA
jgi:hypothetical protein